MAACPHFTRTAPQAFRCSLLRYLSRSPSICSVANLPSLVRECVFTHRIERLLTATSLIAGIAVRTVLRVATFIYPFKQACCPHRSCPPELSPPTLHPLARYTLSVRLAISRMPINIDTPSGLAPEVIRDGVLHAPPRSATQLVATPDAICAEVCAPFHTSGKPESPSLTKFIQPRNSTLI